MTGIDAIAVAERRVIFYDGLIDDIDSSESSDILLIRILCG